MHAARRAARNTVLVRFDVANTGHKDATWMNFALFATMPIAGT